MRNCRTRICGLNSPSPRAPHPQKKRAGFTLLEILVAMIILVIAMSIAFEAFSGTVHAWKRGTEVMEGIKHGDFAMTQLVSAVNSTIYFNSPRKIYAFKFEKNNINGLPADWISFVTSSGAFMPYDSPFARGPHRLNLFIDNDEKGNPALFAEAMPAVPVNEEGEEADFETEPILITRSVQGLEILFWDFELEDWSEEWEKENAIPERILLTVFVAPENEEDDPIEFSRVIEIPVYESMAAKLTGPSLKK